MSIQGWMMQGPSTTSVRLMCRIGRIASSYANAYLGMSGVNAADTVLSKTTNVTVTFTPQGYTEQTTNISDLDNDGGRDCFIPFDLTGLSAGERIPFTLTTDSGGIRDTVTGTLKTIPNGTIKSGTLSCNGNPYIVDNFDGEDDWQSVARLLINKGVDYVGFTEDLYYLPFGHYAADPLGNSVLPFSAPKNTSSDVPADVLPQDGYTDNFVNASSAGNASEENAAMYRFLRWVFLQPAMQILGQHCPICFSQGDHEYASNNWAWLPVDDWDDLTKVVLVGKLCNDLWKNVFGNGNPATYSSTPSTAAYPAALTDGAADPVADYGAVASDFFPGFYKVENDIFTDYFPDMLLHRGKTFPNSADDSMLGTGQYADLVAGITANDSGGGDPKPFVKLSAPKQFMFGFSENTDSMRRDSPTESDALIAVLQARDKAFIITHGDRHIPHQMLDGNLLASCVAALTTGLLESSSLREAYDDSGTKYGVEPGEVITTHLGGAKRDSSEPLSNQTGPHLRHAFSYTEVTPVKLTHELYDYKGNLIGGSVEIEPYNTTIGFAETRIFSEAVNQMNSIEFLVEAGSDGEPTPSFGIGQNGATSGGTIMTPEWQEVLIGEPDGNGEYIAAIMGVFDLNAGMQQGAGIILDDVRTRGLQADNDPLDWPTGLIITVMDPDGSNAKIMDPNTFTGAIQVGSANMTNGNAGKRYNNGNETALMLNATDYRVLVEWPESGGGGTGMNTKSLLTR